MPTITKTETLPPVADALAAAALGVQKHAAEVIQIEQEAQRKSLLPRVLIGLHCLKAHSMFALVDASKRGAMKGKKKTKDAPLTISYESWLESTEANLKKPTTYKYMSAVRGLGCDENSTEAEVTTAFKKLTNPSITSLIAMAVDPVKPPPEKTENAATEQLEFELMRNTLSHYRESCNELLDSRSRLDAFPQMREAAISRVYKTLQELTGQHWQPSEVPHEYAEINPDAIEL